MHRLDPTNPQPIDVAEETLNIRNLGFSPRESLLASAFSLVAAPHDLTMRASLQLQRSPTAAQFRRTIQPQASVHCLAPFIFGA